MSDGDRPNRLINRVDTASVPADAKIEMRAHVRCVGPDGQVRWEADTVPVTITGAARE